MITLNLTRMRCELCFDLFTQFKDTILMAAILKRSFDLFTQFKNTIAAILKRSAYVHCSFSVQLNYETILKWG